MLGLPYDIECTEREGFSFRNTHTLHPQIFSQLRSYSADRFMYIVLIILFALCDNEAAWEHFWKKQLFKTALAWILSKGHSPSEMGFLQHASHCGATGPARSQLQHGPSVDYSMNIFITMVLRGLQGYSLLHHGLLHSLQGNVLWYQMHLLLLH